LYFAPLNLCGTLVRLHFYYEIKQLKLTTKAYEKIVNVTVVNVCYPALVSYAPT